MLLVSSQFPSVIVLSSEGNTQSFQLPFYNSKETEEKVECLDLVYKLAVGDLLFESTFLIQDDILQAKPLSQGQIAKASGGEFQIRVAMNSTRYENLQTVEAFADVFLRVPETKETEIESKEEEKMVGSFDGWRPSEDDEDNRSPEFVQEIQIKDIEVTSTGEVSLNFD